MNSKIDRRTFAGLFALALAAGSSYALPIVYVDATSGNNANDGSLGNPVQTVTNALTKVDSGGTIELAAGTYAERFWVNIDVTIQGPTATPPTAIIKPPFANPIADIHPGENDDGLIDIGSTGNIRFITMKNVTFDGGNFLTVPTLPVGSTRFPLVMFRAGTFANFDNCRWTSHVYSPSSIGSQNNIQLRGVLGNGCTANVDNSYFIRYNKNAIAVITATGATADFNLNGSTFTAADPIVSFPNNQNSQSQNSLQYWAVANSTLNGTVINCTFNDSPPSGNGGTKDFLNYFKTANDNTIGYAILAYADGNGEVADATNGHNNVAVTNCTFNNCLGAVYFRNQNSTPIFNAGNNTFSGGKYMWIDSGQYYGDYFNEPGYINYILYFSGTGSTLHLGPGTYELPRGIVNPATGPVTIDCPAGTATVRFTGPAPANVVAGTGVTFEANYTFPDTDGDGASDPLERMYYSDPNDIDTDNDGYDDGIEIRSVMAGNGSNSGINPRIAAARWGNVYLDSDGDGCPNIVDPGTGVDFDGDGFSDRYEVAQGTNSNNAFEFPVLGDVNGTGLTDNNDASVVFNYYLGNSGAPSNLSRGDIDRNGVVDYVDAVILFNWSLVPKRVPYISYPK